MENKFVFHINNRTNVPPYILDATYMSSIEKAINIVCATRGEFLCVI